MGGQLGTAYKVLSLTLIRHIIYHLSSFIIYHVQRFRRPEAGGASLSQHIVNMRTWYNLF
jgi:hypothetical protein